MKKPVKAGATVRVEAAKARKAARLAKARRAGRTAMASRTAQSTLAAAIGAGILLQGGPASPPSVEMVVRTVAITGPADVVDEPESGADESASGEAGDTGTGDTDSEAASGETVSDDSGESDTGAGGTGSDASGSDDGQAAPDGSDETTTTPSAEPEPTTSPRRRRKPEVVPARTPSRRRSPPRPPCLRRRRARRRPRRRPVFDDQRDPHQHRRRRERSTARPAGDRTAATPTGRATHSATQNLFTRIALALAGLAPHDAHVPGGPATPTSALLIAQWAFFRRGENPLSNQSPVTSPTQSAQTTTGEITGDLNASDPDRDRLTYTLTTGPRNGEVVLHDDGTYTYIPNAATAQTGGTDTFTITVRDNNPAAPGLGGFTALARHVLARSHPALAQRLFGAHAVEVTVDVIVTGTTAPPIPTDVTVGTPDQATGVVRGTLPATDASGAPLTYTVTTPPAYGRVTIRPDGSYVYVPSAAGQAYARTHPGAVDTFTVQASSGARSSFAARVAPGDQLTVPVPLTAGQASVPPVGTAEVAVGSYPDFQITSPDGGHVAVVSTTDRTVTVVDTATGTSVVVGSSAYVGEVAFSPDGGRVYVLDALVLQEPDAGAGSCRRTPRLVRGGCVLIV